MLHTARLLTGGTAGLTFLIDYTTGLGFGLVFFVVNLPFYFFAVRKMGWAFTLKTFAAIALLSLISALSPRMAQAGALPGLLMRARQAGQQVE